MPREILSTARPTALRLWGFVTLVLGGLLMGIGAIGEWATVSGFDTPTAGVDVWEGLVALGAGFVTLIGLLLLRLSGPAVARAIAAVIIVVGLAAAGVAVADAARARTRFTDPGQRDRIAQKLAAESGLPVEPIREAIEAQFRSRFEVSLGLGIFLTIAGGALGATGGALSLVWIRRREGVPPNRDEPSGAGDDLAQS